MDKSHLEKLLDPEKRGHTFLSDEDVKITVPLLDVFSFFCFLVKIHGSDNSYHWVAAQTVRDNSTPSVHFFSSYGFDPSSNSYYDIRRYISHDINIECYTGEKVTKFQPYIAFQEPGSQICGYYAAAFINFNGDIEEMMEEVGLECVNEEKAFDENEEQIHVSHDNDKLIKDFFSCLLCLLCFFFC